MFEFIVLIFGLIAAATIATSVCQRPRKLEFTHKNYIDLRRSNK